MDNSEATPVLVLVLVIVGQIFILVVVFGGQVLVLVLVLYLEVRNLYMYCEATPVSIVVFGG